MLRFADVVLCFDDVVLCFDDVVQPDMDAIQPEMDVHFFAALRAAVASGLVARWN